MKILQIIQRPQLRGAEIFACQLSVELQKSGHSVDVLFLFGEKNKALDFPLSFTPLHASRNKRFWDFKAYKRLANYIIKGNYDIVQANAGDTLKYATLSKKLYNWKAKLVFRNANKMSGFINSKPKLWLNRFFLKQSDYFISVSENCRQDLIQLYPPAKEISATGTIGTFNFDTLKGVNERKENYQVWINVGSLVKEKNHAFLLDIFAQYLSKFPHTELWLIGDGALKKELQQKAVILKISSKVKFWGYQPNAVEFIKAADIMVMPSKIEGLPGVILEALSCGKPVIASNVGGIPEVVHNDENGYVLEEYKVEDYVEKIDKVLNDQELQKSMSQNAQKLIQENFLMPQIAKRFESIYKEIIK